MKRMKNVFWMLLAAGVMTSAGCAGSDGTDGIDGMDGEPGDEDVPSVSAVNPSRAFLDRQTTVTISGNATEWTSAATVDFGAGITVDNVIVASPTAIVVDITIAESAATGRRDVSVSDGDVDITYEGAFAINAPLGFESPLGTLAQGSIVLGRLRQYDTTTPFDVTGAEDDYPYLAADAGAGTSNFLNEATPFTMDVQFLLDVNVTAGATDIRAFSDDSAQGTTSLAPDAMTIAARTPTALTAGANAGTVSAALASGLYSFTPTAHQVVTITATTADVDADAAFALLPPSGSFDDLISYGGTGRYVTETAAPIYVVYWDGSGTTGYTYDLAVTAVASDDLEPNSTCATAQAVSSLPAALSNLALNSATDEDWFSVTVAAGAVGSLFHVVTSAGDPETDTYVEVFSGACGSLTPLGAASSDVDYHEDHLSGAITAAGTYFIKVSPSPEFGSEGLLYDLDISLTPVESASNDTCATAQPATAPYTLTTASLSSVTDQDWFSVTVAAGAVGNLFHVVTSPGDTNTDTLVEVFSGACGSLVSMGVSSDADYHEDMFSTAIPAAGTYFVQVRHAPFAFAGSDYQLEITVELPVDIEPANNTCAGASAGTAGTLIRPLFLSSDTDEDWFQFTATAGDVGDVVHVVTSPGDAGTDTVVEVFAGASCGALVSLGGESDDTFSHEDWTSDPLTAAGSYWVRVSHSIFSFVDDAYDLEVTLE